MAARKGKSQTSSVGGGVIIRRTQGRKGGTNSAVGKATRTMAIGSPRSTSGKVGLDKKTTVSPRRSAS